MSQKQVAFFVDVKRCIGCFSCAMACKNQYHQESGVYWRQLYPLSQEIYPHRDRAWLSLACNHCEHPTCLEVCPVEAYYKRDKDGVVVHEQDKCIGCGNCIRSCPYGAPKYNPVQEKAEKCSFCYQRLDAGLLPACVLGCPTKALSMVELGPDTPPDSIHYIAGFPAFPALNPSIRFRSPSEPRLVRR
ncbi:MAG: 4Fe-4S dicluster domain-containing protein [Deltaproteobacteria bacterium]|nr:4Fe-4S dicluster domain-containing protein [Deltaproteobacteria bacterium]